jgi:hypothetical protein
VRSPAATVLFAIGKYIVDTVALISSGCHLPEENKAV